MTKPIALSESFLIWSLDNLGRFIAFWLFSARRGRGSWFGSRVWIKRDRQNITRHRNAGAADVGHGFDILQRFEFHFYVVITFAQLFEQHLPQVFRRRSWLARRGHAVNDDSDAAFFLVLDCRFDAGQLRIWRNTAREFFQKRSPEEASVE